MLDFAKRNTLEVEEFDPNAEVRKLIDNAFDPSILTEIDESDMPRPKNVLEWITGKKFLNLGNTRMGAVGEGPYSKQVQIELQLHEDYCVAADTMVSSSCGLRQIDYIVGNKPAILLDTKNTPEKPSRFLHTGKRKVRQLRTHDGFTLTGTYEQQVLVLKNDLDICWTPLSKVRVGDVVGIKRQTSSASNIPTISFTYPEIQRYQNSGVKPKVYHTPTYLTPELSRLLGYFVGDGCVRQEAILFTNSNIDVLTDFEYCLRKCFGQVKYYKYPDKQSTSIKIGSRYLIEFLAFIGLLPNKSPNKSVPWIILEADKENVGNFLSALFTCDGSANSNGRAIKFFTSSYEIVTKVQLLLLQFGVISYWSWKKSYWQGKPAAGLYTLMLAGPNAYNFHKQIGFRCQAKQYTGTLFKFNEQLPNVVKSYFRKLIAWRAKHRELYHVSYGGFHRHTSKAFFKRTIDYVTKNIEATYSKQAATKIRVYAENIDNIHWTEVLSNKYAGIKDTYDFTVPHNESFVGNGFVCHNCIRCTDPALISKSQPGKLDIPRDYPLPEIFDHVQLLEHGICPKCKRTKWDYIQEGLFYAPYELAACCGQRSGKSALVAMDGTYTLQRFVIAPSPQKYFGLLPGSLLVHTFTATTWGQADELLWQPFKAWYGQSPWFKEYHKLLDHYGQKLGQQLYYDKTTYYYYAHKRLTGYCETPSIRGLRGPTRFYAAIDEIGWFDAAIDSTKTKINAEGVYTALQNSLETIRSAGDVLREQGEVSPPQAIMCNVSSPSDVNDKIMRQVKAAIRNPRIVPVHMSTWEFNPRQSYEKLRREHTNDLIFWRDFGAMPPWSSSPFFTDDKQLEGMCNSERPQSTLSIIPAENQETRWIEVKAHPQLVTPRLLVIDAGYSANSFAMALSHYNVKDHKTVFDTLIELEPLDKKINFEYIFEKGIVPICEGAHVVQVVYDQWQSLHQISALNNRKITAEKYSLNFADFELVQGVLTAGLAEFPKIELPLSTLKDSPDDLLTALRGKFVIKTLWQILTVRQIGRKVLKPQGEGTNDDLFRTMCISLTYWHNEKTREELLKRKVAGQATGMGMSTRCMGSFRGRGSVGSASPGTGTTNQMATFRSRTNSGPTAKYS